jgi:hypothetical protein
VGKLGSMQRQNLNETAPPPPSRPPHRDITNPSFDARKYIDRYHFGTFDLDVLQCILELVHILLPLSSSSPSMLASLANEVIQGFQACVTAAAKGEQLSVVDHLLISLRNLRRGQPRNIGLFSSYIKYSFAGTTIPLRLLLLAMEPPHPALLPALSAVRALFRTLASYELSFYYEYMEKLRPYRSPYDYMNTGMDLLRLTSKPKGWLGERMMKWHSMGGFSKDRIPFF